MLTTTTPATDEADAGYEAALTALDFYRRHGAGLCDLLGLLADEIAFDALCDLHGQFDSALPDVSLVLGAFQTIRAALAARTTMPDTLWPCVLSIFICNLGDRHDRYRDAQGHL